MDERQSGLRTYERDGHCSTRSSCGRSHRQHIPRLHSRWLFTGMQVLLRNREDDEATQAKLNRELELRVERYRLYIGDERFNDPHLKVPAELVISRIEKRIQSRISIIALVRQNTARTHLRIEQVDERIRAENDQQNNMDAIDMDLSRALQQDNARTSARLDRTYKLEKSAYHPLCHGLLEFRRQLNDEERRLDDIRVKYELLQQLLRETSREMVSLQRENDLLTKENELLKNRMDDIREIPTITEYAYVIKQTKSLEHDIDVWTQRICVAEVSSEAALTMMNTLLLPQASLSQLKQQTKPYQRLPPLRQHLTDP